MTLLDNFLMEGAVADSLVVFLFQILLGVHSRDDKDAEERQVMDIFYPTVPSGADWFTFADIALWKMEVIVIVPKLPTLK